jgi:hypothetical protein
MTMVYLASFKRQAGLPSEHQIFLSNGGAYAWIAEMVVEHWAVGDLVQVIDSAVFGPGTCVFDCGKDADDDARSYTVVVLEVRP